MTDRAHYKTVDSRHFDGSPFALEHPFNSKDNTDLQELEDENIVCAVCHSVPHVEDDRAWGTEMTGPYGDMTMYCDTCQHQCVYDQ